MQKPEFLKGKKGITFVDLFAGAGGFSEGFMQAYTDKKYYDFILASDINENCELTHRVRYNKMLGLDTEFICQDIMEDSFLPNLLKKLKNKKIDVVTGGPSCQSFSLAGRRKKLDKRDDLFEHYLKVIKALRPKYFVMENVKGILTKDGGKIKERILHEIRSIVDTKKMSIVYDFIEANLKKEIPSDLYTVLSLQLHFLSEDNNGEYEDAIYDALEQQFQSITRTIPYEISKSNIDVNTVRHGLILLKKSKERASIRNSLIQLKTIAHIDNDCFVNNYNDIIDSISSETILDSIFNSLEQVKKLGGDRLSIETFRANLELLSMTLDEVIECVLSKLPDKNSIDDFNTLMCKVRLYNIEDPIVVLSSDYGVPQNRERVLFIGSRNDQKTISSIPATVRKEEKVKLYEALWNLDMIKNGSTVTTYKPVKPIKEYQEFLITREITGIPSNNGKLYSEWSKEGRLGHRFTFDIEPFYVRSIDELNCPEKYVFMDLFNHQTSSQNDTVKERLKIIARHGDYDAAKSELKNKNLDSRKRNYVVLDPLGQSPTVCTMPDDFIHYAAYRPTTVREMARLQSFDDSFVFQGKRQTGGNNRQLEIPQYTLVGNAVPPLMARAIANTILENIK